MRTIVLCLVLVFSVSTESAVFSQTTKHENIEVQISSVMKKINSIVREYVFSIGVGYFGLTMPPVSVK